MNIDKNVAFVVNVQGGRDCPWCKKAVDLIDAKGFKYSLRSWAKADILRIAKDANMTTVPIIYHGVILIGGYTELETYLAGES